MSDVTLPARKCDICGQISTAKPAVGWVGFEDTDVCPICLPQFEKWLSDVHSVLHAGAAVCEQSIEDSAAAKSTFQNLLCHVEGGVMQEHFHSEDGS